MTHCLIPTANEGILLRGARAGYVQGTWGILGHFLYFRAWCCPAKRHSREPHSAVVYFTVCVPPIANYRTHVFFFFSNVLVQYRCSTGDTVILRIAGPLPYGNEFQDKELYH